MKYAVASILLFVSAAFAAPQFECPAVDARTANVTYQIPDDAQCDKYFVCIDGVAEEMLCEDGLVFDPHRRSEHKCDLPYLVDCTGREKLQPARPIHNCPRRYGFFNHPEKKACNLILSCVDGEENTFTCPGDLVFESNKGVCVWPEDSTRDGCTRTHEATALADGFKCPTTKQFYGDGTEETNPRYTHPRSCQMFYLCMNGLYPREQSCPTKLAFDPETRVCVDPELVPNCDIEDDSEESS